MVDASGIPLEVHTNSASPAEVNLVQTCSTLLSDSISRSGQAVIRRMTVMDLMPISARSASK